MQLMVNIYVEFNRFEFSFLSLKPVAIPRLKYRSCPTICPLVERE